MGQPLPGTTSVRNIACRAWEVSETGLSDAGRYFAVSALKFRVSLDADIQRGDTVVVDGIGGSVDSIVGRRGHKIAIVDSYGSQDLLAVTVGALLLETEGMLTLEAGGNLLLEDA